MIDLCGWIQLSEVSMLGTHIQVPIVKRIEPMLKMEEPKTLKEDLRRFVGLTNWHRRMYKKWAEARAPLTDMTKVDPRAFKKHLGTEQV